MWSFETMSKIKKFISTIPIFEATKVNSVVISGEVSPNYKKVAVNQQNYWRDELKVMPGVMA